MPYIKYDGRELSIGQRIKLGGREGCVKCRCSPWDGSSWEFFWEGDEVNVIDVSKFPLLEIFIEEPKISKEAAEALKARLLVGSYIYPSEWVSIIDSMTE